MTRWAFHLQIYFLNLKTDIPKVVAQIQKRGHQYEDAKHIDYLKNLNKPARYPLRFRRTV